jgi:protein-S-isoprenylcysteine O-methyltransferase Ste14
LSITLSQWLLPLGVLLIFLSIVMMPPIISRYRKTKTPFDVRKTASYLITDGPYRYSRNPSYVSITVLYIGLGFLLNNAWILILTIPVFLVMDRWIIRNEEYQLETKFGNEYLNYKNTVRRWV